MELGSRDRYAPGSRFGPAPTDDTLVDRLLAQRIVVVGREIDDVLANAVCTALVLLSGESRQRDITLHVNSPGGSAGAALAIYDTMRWVAPDVATVGYGTAGSVAQFLLTAGAAGKRTALPHARVVLGHPRVEPEGGDVRTRSEQLARGRREIAELVARHSGRPLDEVAADCARERWFTAAEAVAHGLVDRVAERDTTVGPGIGAANGH